MNSASPVTGAQQLAPIRDAAALVDMALADGVFFNQRRLIVERAAANRLPAMYPEREYAEVRGLLAYGPSVPDNFRRAAGYIARILRGANPGDLPIEQPAKFELVINLNAATALGLTIPAGLLSFADEVIE